MPVALVARAGADVAGRGAVAELRDAGVVVHVALDGERATGTCVVVIGADGERTMLPDRGANLALAPDDVPAALFVPGGHLHLSGYVLLHDGPRAAGLAALDHAREAGMTISVDPASAAPLAACGVERVLGWIGGVDVLAAQPRRGTGAEWRGRSGGGGAGADARAPARSIVTLGASGALWTDGHDIVRVDAAESSASSTLPAPATPSPPAGSPRDGRRRTADALSAACALGARAVTVAGARPQSPTRT